MSAGAFHCPSDRRQRSFYYLLSRFDFENYIIAPVFRAVKESEPANSNKGYPIQKIGITNVESFSQLGPGFSTITLRNDIQYTGVFISDFDIESAPKWKSINFSIANT